MFGATTDKDVMMCMMESLDAANGADHNRLCCEQRGDDMGEVLHAAARDAHRGYFLAARDELVRRGVFKADGFRHQPWEVR